MKWKFVAVLCIFTVLSVPAVAKNIYIFSPVDVHARFFQQQVAMACPSFSMVVFGRGTDFRAQLMRSPPDAIIAPFPTIDRSFGFKMIVRGMQDGSTKGNSLLVSLDNVFDVSQINNKKIGVVDILGRGRMNEFVSELLQADMKLRRVSKNSDLLRLLTFGLVDAVLVSKNQYENMKSISSLNLVATKLDVEVGLVGVASANASINADLISCIEGFNSELNEVIGVDQWRIL